MTTVTLHSKSQATSTEAVRFNDGMLVTAEDLTTAGRYPLDVLQVLVRSYFGCGIVCGLGLGRDPLAGRHGTTEKNCPPGDASSFVIQVDGGVAVDCHGFPLELCKPLRLDLTPDPCSCDEPPTELCIAIRHVTSDSMPKASCGCSAPGAGDSLQCSRVRDHVQVGAFPCDRLPEDTCKAEPRNPVDKKQGICDCLKACPGDRCCGESWVLLGRVTLGPKGVTDTDDTQRQYVKPIQCLCETRPATEQPSPDGKPLTDDTPSRAEMAILIAEVKRHSEEIGRLRQMVDTGRPDPAVAAVVEPAGPAEPTQGDPAAPPGDIGGPVRTPRQPRGPT